MYASLSLSLCVSEVSACVSECMCECMCFSMLNLCANHIHSYGQINYLEEGGGGNVNEGVRVGEGFSLH